MIFRKPKPSKFGSLIKGGIVFAVTLEAAAAAGSYLVYRKLNTDQDFRLYMRSNYPFVLDTYYKIGEYFNLKTRQEDAKSWSLPPPGK